MAFDKAPTKIIDFEFSAAAQLELPVRGYWAGDTAPNKRKEYPFIPISEATLNAYREMQGQLSLLPSQQAAAALEQADRIFFETTLPARTQELPPPTGTDTVVGLVDADDPDSYASLSER